MSLSMTSTFIKPMHPEGRRFVAIRFIAYGILSVSHVSLTAAEADD